MQHGHMSRRTVTCHDARSHERKIRSSFIALTIIFHIIAEYNWCIRFTPSLVQRVRHVISLAVAFAGVHEQLFPLAHYCAICHGGTDVSLWWAIVLEVAILQHDTCAELQVGIASDLVLCLGERNLLEAPRTRFVSKRETETSVTWHQILLISSSRNSNLVTIKDKVTIPDNRSDCFTHTNSCARFKLY